jgi:hypothetical protein
MSAIISASTAVMVGGPGVDARTAGQTSARATISTAPNLEWADAISTLPGRRKPRGKQRSIKKMLTRRFKRLRRIRFFIRARSSLAAILY